MKIRYNTRSSKQEENCYTNCVSFFLFGTVIWRVISLSFSFTFLKKKKKLLKEGLGQFCLKDILSSGKWLLEVVVILA
uniref:Uncharacterized protein n=1 Tax=Octopus bimaculoides TaxID=37653 RepID=A0A0L8GM21_OCTBM